MTADNPGYSFVLRDGVGFAQTPGAMVVLQAEPGAAMVVPHGALLLAAFVRQGADLLLVWPDGTQILIKGYFALDHPPALITEGGAMLAPDLVARLAGPLAPGQYAQAAPGAEAAPIGRVATADGTVTATRVDGTQIMLATDSAVFQGDVLETGDGAAVGLVFTDDTTFSLGADARMVLDELVYDPDTGSGRAAFSVLQGVFVFVSGEIAASGPDQMVVRTPVATLGIRGTKVAGRAAAEGESNVITLLPEADGSVGGISVTNASGTITLSQAFQTTLVTTALLPPSPPVVLPVAAANLLYGGVERTAARPEAEAPGAREGEAAPERGAAPEGEAAGEGVFAEGDPEGGGLPLPGEVGVGLGDMPLGPEGMPLGPEGMQYGPEGMPFGPEGMPFGPEGMPGEAEMAAAHMAAAAAIMDALYYGDAPDVMMVAAAGAAMAHIGPALPEGAHLSPDAVQAFALAWGGGTGASGEAMQAAMSAFGPLVADPPQMSVTTPVAALGLDL